MSENNEVDAVVPRWFIVASWIALAWNVLGLMAFAAQMAADPQGLPVEQQAYYANIPLWATLGFAAAVIAGTGGCVGLIVRRRWATILLVVSLLGLLVQLTHGFLIADGLEVFGAVGLIMPLLTTVVAVALLWLARQAGTRGWLAG